MKERLKRLTTKLKSKAELKQLIQQVYDSIDLETINIQLNIFEYRIQMVKDFSGKTIARFIRKNYHSIPDELKASDDKCPPFLEPDTYLKFFLDNLKTLKIIVKNKALKIERYRFWKGVYLMI